MAQTIEIDDVSTIGVVTDQDSFNLPPEAWTTATNMRVVDSSLQKIAGWQSTFGTPPIAPHFAIPVRTQADTFWLYVSLTAAYAYDGTSHAKVTRQSAGVDVPYTANATRDWNGTLLGGVPILNNFGDIPQSWSPTTLATKLVNLPNWPSTMRAKVIRSFGPFLTALNISKSGTGFPHMFKWSHPADPGSVPVTWDETDETHDAGEVDLPDVDAGITVDMLPLGETMFVYKEGSIRKVRYVGGQSIFDFGQSAWITGTGLLAPGCVCVTGDGTKQVFASQDDIMWHNGSTIRSVLNGKRRRELANLLDSSNYVNSFMFCNPFFGEVWFCYVPQGQTQPTRAFVMNYLNGDDNWPITDVDGITFRNAIPGNFNVPNAEEWQDGTDQWQDDTGPWSVLARRRTICCGTDATKFYNLDATPDRDGVTFSGLLQRLGLSVLGKKRNGDWVVDFDRMKMWDTLWPKISGAPCSIRIGKQDLVNGPVTWGSPITFTPGTDIDCAAGPISGRALALEISGVGTFKVSGYKFDVQDLGNY